MFAGLFVTMTMVLSSNFVPHKLDTYMLNQVNIERSYRGLPPLVLCPELTKGCRRWSQFIAQKRFLRHDVGFRENIACGQPSIKTVMRTWMNSSGHRRNILSNCTRFGCGWCRDASGKLYWTQRFQ